ncbi:hypothetical protein QJS66_08410 [Kocuria rhizophila]|nr:hypothetical protein QJS66_08410 [Kocuria rhizophila]
MRPRPHPPPWSDTPADGELTVEKKPAWRGGPRWLQPVRDRHGVVAIVAAPTLQLRLARPGLHDHCRDAVGTSAIYHRFYWAPA